MKAKANLMTAREVGDYLRMSEQAVYNAVNRKELPHLKIGRRLRFDPDAIERWLTKRRVGCRR